MHGANMKKFTVIVISTDNRGISFGIFSIKRAGRPRIHGLIPGMTKRIFSSVDYLDQQWGPTSSVHTW